MMKLQLGVDATRALQGARHKVFVEGSNDEEIDPIVVGELLRLNGLTQIEVRPMGGCDNVRSAAQALIRHHPSYYFLIDRDDQDQEVVEHSWVNFPNPETHNMLIWQKRELENYFIDPDYIEKSSFLNVPVKKLKEYILKECNRRIFLDAANLTLLKLHREARKPFASNFCDPQLFSSKADGMHQLESLPAFESKSTSIADLFAKDAIRELYSDFVCDLSGGILPLNYGSGTWLERMSGKEVFRCIAGPCFKVTTANGSTLQGKLQNNEIAKQLLALPLDQQPADFQRLCNLLKARVSSNA
ncbi:MAG: hypothetical protein ACKN9T_19810 [Candidatus Methylumidiphilus sp.]